MKRCSRCGETKAESEFYRSEKSKDGFAWRCKDCDRKRKEALDYEPRTTGEKTCSRCKRTLYVSQFSKNRRRKDGLDSWCKTCSRGNASRYQREHHERYLKYQRHYQSENREKLKVYDQDRNERLKRLAFEAYGGIRCAWPGCNETHLDVLSLDHIAQDGARLRRQGEPGGRQLYAKLRREGYPPGYRVLCRNHNWKAWLEYKKKLRDKSRKEQRRRQLRRSVKIKALRIYGRGKIGCVECGETDVDVLSIDHIYGGGCEHRRKLQYCNLHTHLKKLGFPNKELYQVLCRNCNWLKGLEQSEETGERPKPKYRQILLEI